MARLLIVALLSVSAFAQTARPVDVIRLTLTVDKGKETDGKFYGLARRELKSRRNIALASPSGRADYDVYATVTEIRAGGKTLGYAAAVLVMVPDASKRGYRVELQAITGATLEGLAQTAASQMEKLFKKETR